MNRLRSLVQKLDIRVDFTRITIKLTHIVRQKGLQHGQGALRKLSRDWGHLPFSEALRIFRRWRPDDTDRLEVNLGTRPQASIPLHTFCTLQLSRSDRRLYVDPSRPRIEQQHAIMTLYRRSQARPSHQIAFCLLSNLPLGLGAPKRAIMKAQSGAFLLLEAKIGLPS